MKLEHQLLRFAKPNRRPHPRSFSPCPTKKKKRGTSFQALNDHTRWYVQDAKEASEATLKASTPPERKTQYTPTIVPPPNTANEYSDRAPAVAVTDVVESIGWEGFKTVHKQPCVRNSLLYGIGSGFAFGGLRLVLGAPVPRAANWAVGTFTIASLASYKFCQYRRYRERAGMQRAVETIDRQKLEHERHMKEKQERQKHEAEKRSAEEEAARLNAMRPWYRFW